MTTQEIYFRVLVALLGLAIFAGSFIVNTVIIMQVLEAIGGLVIIFITFIKRFTSWL